MKIRSWIGMAVVTGGLVLAGSASADVPAVGVKVEKDIVFGKGGGDELKLDLYQPADHVDSKDSVLPGLLIIYGGAWRSGNKEVMRIFGEQYARAGYVVAAVSYRLFPKYRFPACVEDCKCAVRWMRSEAASLRIDPHRIGAMGLSAGGHLSMMLGYMDDSDGLQGEGGHTGLSSQVQCVVNYFGPFNLTLRDWKEKDERLLVDFVGGKIDERLDDYKRASPSTYVDSDDAPTITIHGTADPLVPYGQAVLVDKILREKGVESLLVPVEGAGHGWWGADLQRTQRMSIEFLDKHLKGDEGRSARPRS
jgi:acetyl esterase/lipase